MNLSRQSSGETPEPPSGPVYPPSLMPQPAQQPSYVIASTGQQLPAAGFSGSAPSISQQVLQAPPSPQGFVQQPPPAQVSMLFFSYLWPIADLWYTLTSISPCRMLPGQSLLPFWFILIFSTYRTWSVLFSSCAQNKFNETDPTVHDSNGGTSHLPDCWYRDHMKTDPSRWCPAHALSRNRKPWTRGMSAPGDFQCSLAAALKICSFFPYRFVAFSGANLVLQAGAPRWI